MLFHTHEWEKSYFFGVGASLFLFHWRVGILKDELRINLGFLSSPSRRQPSPASTSWLFLWSSLKTLPSFRGENGSWIKHKSQLVFDVPHVCFAMSLSWDLNQSGFVHRLAKAAAGQKLWWTWRRNPVWLTQSLRMWLFSSWPIHASKWLLRGTEEKTLQ